MSVSEHQMDDTDLSVSLDVGDCHQELSLRRGTLGPDVIDIGLFTPEPAAYLRSEFHLDRELRVEDHLHRRRQGRAALSRLSHRRARRARELYGSVLSPILRRASTKKQDEEFQDLIAHHTMVHEQMTRFYTGFRRDAHPMAIMVGVVGALSAFYHDSTDIKDPKQREIAHRLIAKMPTIAAMAYKYSIGQPFVYPRNELKYSANFLQMCFAVPCEEYKVDPILARAIDRIFILHADHEQNASTSTVRLAGSSGANPFACISAGIACLWGPAHGGANEAALQMLQEIGTVDRIPEIIKRAKDKNDSFRLMGFGHRVYKNYDPRARSCRRPVMRCSRRSATRTIRS